MEFIIIIIIVTILKFLLEVETDNFSKESLQGRAQDFFFFVARMAE